MTTKDKKFLAAMNISPGEDDCKMCELSEQKAALAREDAERLRERLLGSDARETLLIDAKRQWKDEARKWETRCFMAVLVAAFLLAALVVPVMRAKRIIP